MGCASSTAGMGCLHTGVGLLPPRTLKEWQGTVELPSISMFDLLTEKHQRSITFQLDFNFCTGKTSESFFVRRI